MELLRLSIVQSLEASLGVSTFTPIQERCITELLNHKDVIAQAPTGSGKTLAYLLPCIELLLRVRKTWKPHEALIGAVVLVPGRELATQVSNVTGKLLNSGHFTLKHIAFIGGSAVRNDVDNFRANGGNIIVATPGRFEELICGEEETELNLKTHLKNVELFVLDEADRFIEAGFRNSVSSILAVLPKQRRTALMSATQAKDMEDMMKFGMRNPLRITISEKGVVGSSGEETQCSTSVLPGSLKAYYTVVPVESKLSSLLAFLRCHVGERGGKTLVFFSSCACVDYFARIISAMLQGVSISSIHGKKRTKRQKLFERFRKQSSGIMLCTDVMSRGIDIPDIDWVVQFDPPKRSTWFVHRSGRSARFGRDGNCLLLLSHSEEGYVDFLKAHEQVPLEEMKLQEGITTEEGLLTMQRVRAIALKDRAFLEKGSKAFVSYIQAYSKHDCGVVCSLKALDIVNAAHCFGLLRLPRMPEMRDRDLSGFIHCEKNTADIKYKDKTKEKKRRQQRVTRAAAGGTDITRQPAQLETELPAASANLMSKGKQTRLRKTTTNAADRDDFDDDYRLMKKLKKGKITQQHFNDNFGDDL